MNSNLITSRLRKTYFVLKLKLSMDEKHGIHFSNHIQVIICENKVEENQDEVMLKLDYTAHTRQIR